MIVLGKRCNNNWRVRMSGDVETSQADLDLKALEGFLVALAPKAGIRVSSSVSTDARGIPRPCRM